MSDVDDSLCKQAQDPTIIIGCSGQAYLKTGYCCNKVLRAAPPPERQPRSSGQPHAEAGGATGSLPARLSCTACNGTLAVHLLVMV